MQIGTQKNAVARIVTLCVADGVRNEMRCFQDLKRPYATQEASRPITSYYGVPEFPLISPLAD